MSCSGCKRRAKKFKKEVAKMEKEVKEVKEETPKLTDSELRELEHFKKVCKHGVPEGYMCKTCNKVIEIPLDAVIKPKGWVKPEEK